MNNKATLAATPANNLPVTILPEQISINDRVLITQPYNFDKGFEPRIEMGTVVEILNKTIIVLADSDLASSKSYLSRFCKHNNIPLSEQDIMDDALRHAAEYKFETSYEKFKYKEETCPRYINIVETPAFFESNLILNELKDTLNDIRFDKDDLADFLSNLKKIKVGA